MISERVGGRITASLLFLMATPIVRAAVFAGVSPNALSGGSFLLMASAPIVLVLAGNYWVFASLWFAGLLLDCTDGQVARATGNVNKSAFSLDHFLDLLKLPSFFIAVSIYFDSPWITGFAITAMFSIMLYEALTYQWQAAVIAHHEPDISSDGRSSGRNDFKGTLHSPRREASTRAPLWRRSMASIFTYDVQAMILFMLMPLSSSIFVIGAAYLCVICFGRVGQFVLMLRTIPKPGTDG